MYNKQFVQGRVSVKQKAQSIKISLFIFHSPVECGWASCRVRHIPKKWREKISLIYKIITFRIFMKMRNQRYLLYKYTFYCDFLVCRGVRARAWVRAWFQPAAAGSEPRRCSDEAKHISPWKSGYDLSRDLHNKIEWSCMIGWDKDWAIRPHWQEHQLSSMMVVALCYGCVWLSVVLVHCTKWKE